MVSIQQVKLVILIMKRKTVRLASDPSTWKDSSNDGSYGEVVWIATTPPLSDPSALGVAAAQTFYMQKVSFKTLF